MVLKLRREAPDWEKANCLGSAPIRLADDHSEEIYDPWFDEEDPWPVMSVCNGTDGLGICPVRDACLSFALQNNERFGVWGGTTEQDRRAIRKKWRWRAGSEPREEWRWYPPGEVTSMLTEREMKELTEDDD
jgi:Transcription factor WhiB